MWNKKSYRNFELTLDGEDGNYRVWLNSPAGNVKQSFSLPPSLENEDAEKGYIRGIGLNRGDERSLAIEHIDVPKAVNELGSELFQAIFDGRVGEYFRESLRDAKRDKAGLRICLRLSGASRLINIPWEFLFDTRTRHYIGLSVDTPIIRKLDGPKPEESQVEGVLRILVMISSPKDYSPLDVEMEWGRIDNATKVLQKNGQLTLTRVRPSLDALQEALQQEDYHVFHFIGHGGFDDTGGVLVLEDEQKNGERLSGQSLGTFLHDEPTIQLVLLNSCSGAKTSGDDPFVGVGQGLLQAGIPAVIAMRMAISDKAAIVFSQAFYGALVNCYPIDAAVAEARKLISGKVSQFEWATPVLYTSIDGGSLVKGCASKQQKEDEVNSQAGLKHQENTVHQAELKRQQEEEAKQQAELEQQEKLKQQEEEAKPQAELKQQKEEAKHRAELKHQEEETKHQVELRHQEQKVKSQTNGHL